MSKLEIIFIGNDNVLELLGLKDEVAGAFLNAATVTVTLLDKNSAEVAGQVWPVTLTYVAASDGDYRTTLQDVLSLSSRQKYTAVVDADGGAGLKGHWEVPLRAEIRRE